MLLMSATLNSPELFAGWLEEITIKQVMLCITEHRSVPLYHYMWLNSTKNIMKQDNKFINNCNTFCDKLVPIKTNNNIYTDNLYKIRDIKTYCKKKGLKFFLSNDVKLAIKLGLDGAYLPSFNKSIKHLAFSLKKNWNLELGPKLLAQKLTAWLYSQQIIPE